MKCFKTTANMCDHKIIMKLKKIIKKMTYLILINKVNFYVLILQKQKINSQLIKLNKVFFI